VYLLDYVDEIARMLILRFASNPNGVEQMVSERTEESMTTESDGRTILVIDDDRVLADTLSDILRKHGFKPVALYSGEEALELAGRFRPDVVLSDIRMSRLDGIEAAKRIRMLHPEYRIDSIDPIDSWAGIRVFAAAAAPGTYSDRALPPS
jgi:CheY-like chemotaxis protein